MAGGGLSGRDQRHPALAGTLARPSDGARSMPFYFCQLEAIETLIWWVEGAGGIQAGHLPSRRWRAVGAPLQQDGHRHRQDDGDGDDHHLAGAERADLPEANKDFSRAIFVVAPGLTVKERLQVLYPGEADNVYDEFALCPSEAMRQKLNQAEILVENWHTLMPLKAAGALGGEEGRGERRGLYAPGAGQAGGAQGHLVVINDEAHHAYRHAGRMSRSARRRRTNWASTSTRRRAGSRGWIASTRRGASSAASISPPRRSRRPARRTPRRGCLTGSFRTSA